MNSEEEVGVDLRLRCLMTAWIRMAAVKWQGDGGVDERLAG